MKRYLVLPDMQLPYEDKRAVGCALNYAIKQKWDGVVNLGDMMDFNVISSHNHGKPKLVEGERIARDGEYGRRHLKECRQAVGTKADFWLLKGNHEYRLDRYVEQFPALDGLLDLSTLLDLKGHNVKLINCYPSGDTLKLGHLRFHHGYYTGQNHAKKHLKQFGCNLVYGHCHNVEMASDTQLGRGKAIAAWSLGCLCRYDLPYQHGRPNNWQHAIGEVHIDEKTGNFNVHVIRIFNGRLLGLDGKPYHY